MSQRPLPANQGPLGADDVLRLGLQIASALEDAHAAGIFHRDLKPDNILLTRKGSIKLLDFSIAKSTGKEEEAATTLSGVVGTPLYMSPEQAEGASVDASSDIFSLGAVLYELCAGRRAFRQPGGAAARGAGPVRGRRHCDR